MSQNNINNKNVIITGGLGFIGSNLALELIKRGCHVTVVDSLIPEYGGNLYNLQETDKITINISDVRDRHSFKHLIKEKDFLFNLAGQTSHLDSMQNPFPDLEINTEAQLSIVEACRNHNPAIRIVYASTRQIYGKPQILPVDENHPIKPVDVNGINKLAGEWYHMLYHNVYGIRTSVLRLTNTYGPRMRIKDARQTFLGIWIKCALEGIPFKVFGDGKQIRDFNYVDDVVNALIMVAESEDAYGSVFNLGADDPLNLLTAADILSQNADNAPYEIVPFPKELRPIDIGDYYGDYRFIRAKVGWKPMIGFDEGIKLTLNYFHDKLRHYL
jgi:nucleoside-diphosphate-sugar epimerase